MCLCCFSPQIHQAGGQAGFEERKVSFLVTMWKRFDQDLISPRGPSFNKYVVFVESSTRCLLKETACALFMVA